MVDYEWLNLILYINDTGVQYKVFLKYADIVSLSFTTS